MRWWELEIKEVEIDKKKDNTPKFKYLDIISEKKTNNVLYVMVYNKDDDCYVVEELDGYSIGYKREYIENHYEKIGEVTKDVLKRLNPNIK